MDEKALEGGRFFMKHYSYEQWTKYVKNELDGEDRILYEDHLYTCDQCLEVYLTAIEAEELPDIIDGTAFTDNIMAQLPIENNIQDTNNETFPRKATAFYKKTIFHYGVAAAMTLLLMSTGFFQTLTQYAGDVESKQFKEDKASITEGIMDKTFAWMDTKKEEDKK